MGKRGTKPKLYDLHGRLVSVKRFSQMLNIPLSSAYRHLEVCGGDIAAAYVRADRVRTRKAELKIARIIMEGGAQG